MAGKSLNKVMLIGHAGKDAEVKYTGAGKAVANFTLATNISWKDKTSGQLQEKTEWHNIVVWERLAEICGEYVKKGKRVYIEGRIETRTYDDKEGVKKYFTEIIANDMIHLDGGQGGGQSSEGGGRSASPARSSAPPVPANDFDQAGAVDDLPF